MRLTSLSARSYPPPRLPALCRGFDLRPIDEHILILTTTASGTKLPVRLGLAICLSCFRSTLS